MEPKAEFVQDIAILDPVAAYGIMLGIPRVPISFNATGSFSSFTVGALPIEAGLDTTITQRTWIDNIQYSLLCPNVFAGNVLKTLWDAMLKAQPGISIKLTVHSGPKYLVSPQYTPLESFVNNLKSRWTNGWPLFKQQNIAVSYLLTQAPGGNPPEPSGPPYIVTLTFNGWQFLDHTVDEISVDVAAKQLRKLGFWVPDAVECP